MKSLQCLITASVACALLACGQPTAELEQAQTDLPTDLQQQALLRFAALPTMATNPENPTNDAMVALGKRLYFDPQLSRDGHISCNSCHNLASFGVDNLPTSPGDTEEHGSRNSPTVLNAALHGTQFWDGRAVDVEEQAGMPILNPIEMAIPSEQFLVDRLAGIAEYPSLFATAFPHDPDPLSYGNIQRALGAFERTLLTPSRFDAYLDGDDTALSRQEKTGLHDFIQLGCATCHNGVNLGAATFQKFGLAKDYWEETQSPAIDEGRFQVTGDEADKFVFRVASLRNVEKTAPYFHDGSVDTLEEAIAVMIKLQLGLEPGEREIENIASFLRSLTGEVPMEALQSAGM